MGWGWVAIVAKGWVSLQGVVTAMQLLEVQDWGWGYRVVWGWQAGLGC
jgi:hypothetical protein